MVRRKERASMEATTVNLIMTKAPTYMDRQVIKLICDCQVTRQLNSRTFVALCHQHVAKVF